MKFKFIRHRLGGYGAALFISAVSSSADAEILVDGTRDTGNETDYAERAVQATPSNWGAGNTLANVHTAQDGSDLAVFIGGKVSDNAIILFIDSKAGGLASISNTTITTGGEEYTINRLGRPSTTGLTFENGFTPDYAIRIWGNGSGTEAYVNRYDLQAGSRGYVGQTVAAVVPASGFVSEIRTLWTDTAAPLSGVVNGVEMKLSLAGLGVPSGAGQPVRLMAMLVNGGSSYASNQVLGSLTNTANIGGEGGDGTINPINFETEAGIQTISLTVDNTDTDGDGLNNDEDPDDDGDGLDDIAETATGIYVSAADTGTNPLVKDSDGDSYFDGDEVGSTLGYVSNPNLPNYTEMTIPGSFNMPAAWNPTSGGNTPSTDMTQGPVASLTEQYIWTLNYKFTAPGAIQYKYAAGSWAKDWGNGGNNFTTAIQATGFHTFTFNNATLAESNLRSTFVDSTAYLTAYGLSADPTGDSDGDTISNEAEFIANTDPTNDDSDGDGLLDGVDPLPLVAAPQSRDIVFSVNMTVQSALGNFDPGVDAVAVDFFEGAASPLPDLTLTDTDSDGIWTGTLTGFQGTAGSSFGTYKFKHSHPSAASSGYEGSIANRTFNLGAADTTQPLDIVFFDDNSTTPVGFSSWAGLNAGGQSAAQDYDSDGVDNGLEYFMGQTGSSFTANPQAVARVVSWPRNPAATGVTFKVWTSPDLSSWIDVTASAAISDPNYVKYTLPAGTAPVFVRLAVTVP